MLTSSFSSRLAGAVFFGALMFGCSTLLGTDWNGSPNAPGSEGGAAQADGDAPQISEASDEDAASPPDAGGSADADGGEAASCPSSSSPCDAGCCPRVKAIGLALGSLHSCALLDGGKVVCWGNNQWGQIGAPLSLPRSSKPLDVANVSSGVTEIAAYHGHTCAVRDSNDVACWGLDDHGQLIFSDPPGSPPNPTPIVSRFIGLSLEHVAAGRGHTCITFSSGTVQCWGDDSRGQLGGSLEASADGLVDVEGLSANATGIVAGAMHTCALTGDGAMCWGANGGALGNGGTDDSATAVPVKKLSKVTSIGAGEDFTCAVSDGGTCWGHRPGGGVALEPVAVDGLDGASVVAAHKGACFIVGSGVKCWTAPSPQPSDVPGLASDVTDVRVGDGHACAIRAGDVFCWGDNREGQCGADVSTPAIDTPVRVEF